MEGTSFTSLTSAIRNALNREGRIHHAHGFRVPCHGSDNALWRALPVCLPKRLGRHRRRVQRV